MDGGPLGSRFSAPKVSRNCGATGGVVILCPSLWGRMKPGDLVKYRNTHRIPKPLVGMILDEKFNISVDQRFFNVLLEDGVVKLISEHYLEDFSAER